MNKKLLYLFGLITLIIFPLPTLFIQYFYWKQPVMDLFQLDQLGTVHTFVGILFGLISGISVGFILELPLFEKIPNRIEPLVQSLNLAWYEKVFLAFCAGFGEELLFRAGLQAFFGIGLTSFLFIAIHGYFSFKPLIKSLYGITLLPFILLISYGYSNYGIWFAIAAHFSYDFILFILIDEAA